MIFRLGIQNKDLKKIRVLYSLFFLKNQKKYFLEGGFN
jgi:hypothetical protein